MENTSLTSSYGRSGPITGKTISRVSMDSALSKIATGEKTLPEGQTLKARVLDFMGKDLTLRLPDGTVVQARTPQGAALSIGQNAEFQVVSSNPEQLLLRLINSDAANSATSIAGRALAAAGVPMTEENLTLVNTLLENRLPVDADSIRTLVQQSGTYKSAEITTLAQMNKNNIPVNQKNIDQYNNYLNYEHRMMPQLEGLAEALASPELSAILEEYGINPDTLDAMNEAAAQMGTEAEATPGEGAEATAGQKGTANINAVGQNTGRIAAEADLANVPAGETAAKMLASAAESLTTGAEATGKAAENAAKENTASTENTQNAAAGKSAEIDNSISSKSEEANSFLKRWTLTPEKLREGSVEEVFERLNNDLKQITSALRKAKAQNPDAEETLSKLLNDTTKAAQNLKDNLEFMNVLNRFFPFVQLPMRMEEKYQHGELYVYTRKKAKPQDGSASVLLHLDMDNLGPTDIYLSIAGTTLGAKFYLTDNEISDLFRENLPELTERLEKQGLTVNCELLPREEAENPVHEFLAPDENVSLKRYRFDCRA